MASQLESLPSDVDTLVSSDPEQSKQHCEGDEV